MRESISEQMAEPIVEPMVAPERPRFIEPPRRPILATVLLAVYLTAFGVVAAGVYRIAHVTSLIAPIVAHQPDRRSAQSDHRIHAPRPSQRAPGTTHRNHSGHRVPRVAGVLLSRRSAKFDPRSRPAGLPSRHRRRPANHRRTLSVLPATSVTERCIGAKVLYPACVAGPRPGLFASHHLGADERRRNNDQAVAQ